MRLDRSNYQHQIYGGVRGSSSYVNTEGDFKRIEGYADAGDAAGSAIEGLYEVLLAHFDRRRFDQILLDAQLNLQRYEDLVRGGTRRFSLNRSA
jgi:hypothetical protein